MLEKIKLEVAFKLNILILKSIGAWNLDYVSYKIYKHTLTIISFSLYLSTIIEIAGDAGNRHMFYTVMAELVAPLKLIIFRKNFNKIMSTLNILNLDCFQPKNVKQKHILQKAINLARNLHFAYFCILCFVLFMLYFPNYLLKKLSLLVWVPFDYNQPIYYEVVFIYTVVGGACCAYSSISIDSFLWISWIQIKSQLMCVCDTLRNLKKISKHRGEQKKTILLNCVQHYNAILEYVHLLNQSYSGIITVQVMFSTMSICSTMYYISLVSIDNNSY